jgi:hypothetical protein
LASVPEALPREDDAVGVLRLPRAADHLVGEKEVLGLRARPGPSVSGPLGPLAVGGQEGAVRIHEVGVPVQLDQPVADLVPLARTPGHGLRGAAVHGHRVDVVPGVEEHPAVLRPAADPVGRPLRHQVELPVEVVHAGGLGEVHRLEGVQVHRVEDLVLGVERPVSVRRRAHGAADAGGEDLALTRVQVQANQVRPSPLHVVVPPVGLVPEAHGPATVVRELHPGHVLRGQPDEPVGLQVVDRGVGLSPVAVGGDHLTGLEVIVHPVPDVHVGAVLVGLPLLLLFPDSHHEPRPVLRPPGVRQLRDHEAGRERRGLGRAHDPGLQACTSDARGHHQGVDPVGQSVLLGAGQGRQAIARLAPGQVLEALFGAPKRLDPPLAHRHQVDAVPHLLRGVHQVGQVGRGLVEAIFRDVPEIQDGAGGEVPEQEVRSLVVGLAVGALPVHGQEAAVLREGEGPDPRVGALLARGEVQQVKGAGHRLALLPQLVGLLLGWAGEECGPTAVPGESRVRTVDGFVTHLAIQLLEEEGRVPVVRAVRVAHPPAVGREGHLRDAAPRSVVLQGQGATLLGEEPGGEEERQEHGKHSAERGRGCGAGHGSSRKKGAARGRA